MRALLGLSLIAGALAQVNRVQTVPGYNGQLPFALYTGYASHAAGTTFFMQADAENTSSQDYIFWVNGACSGMIGATFEGGPFRVAVDGTVSVNPARWNKQFTTVFLDVSGLGFSPPIRGQPNDNAAAAEIYRFIQWFVNGGNPRPAGTAQPRYWISGEGYAGHYVPLAAELVAANGLFVNGGGVILMSPITSPTTLAPYALQAAKVHNAIRPDTHDTILATCSTNEIVAALLDANATGSGVCAEALEAFVSGSEAGNAAFAFRHYYVDTCDVAGGAKPTPDGTYDPCAANHALAWLQRPDVQRALFISSGPVSFEWCSPLVWNAWAQADKIADATITWRRLLRGSSAFRTLIVSGDSAGLPPFTDSQAWLRDLIGLPTKTGFDWLPWYANTNLCQVGGYSSVFNTGSPVEITLTSIRFAGLYSAWDEPTRVMVALERFILNNDASLGGVVPPLIPTSCPDLPWETDAQSIGAIGSASTAQAVEAALAAKVAEERVRPTAERLAEEFSKRPRNGAAASRRVGRDGHTPISLPNAPTVSFDQYTGYVQVGGTAGVDSRNLFYWLIEAADVDPTAAPTLLWLQGGPGCSGLFGMFTEIGPLRAFAANGTTTLLSRDVAWNSFANILIVESPVCVGFSYKEGDQTYCANQEDAGTVEDNYNFVLGFLKAFPSLAANDFWVTGESYAGHYIPELVDRIVQGNNDPNGQKVPLAGLMAGNPLSDVEADLPNDLIRWGATPIIPSTTAAGIRAHCTDAMLAGFQVGPCNEGTCTEYEKKRYGISDDCWPFIVQVTPGTNQPGNIDFASPVVDVCPVAHADYQKTANTPYQPCGQADCGTYLSRTDVQRALGVHSPLVGQPWDSCSNSVNLGYSFNSTLVSMKPVYQRIFAAATPAGLKKPRILIYSGDTDEIISFISTNNWTSAIGGATTADRRPWYLDTNGNQLAGTVTVYEHLTFASVRGAGHMVPSYQPARALALVQHFVANNITRITESAPAVVVPAGKRICGRAISPSVMFCDA